MDFLPLARSLAAKVSNMLTRHLSSHGYQGVVSRDINNLKSVHLADEQAADIIFREMSSYPVHLHMESFEPQNHHAATHHIFIDPVDGSVNWDRGIGDPAFCMAATSKIHQPTYQDLEFVYVQGLRSGDVYYYQGERLFYQNYLTGKLWQLNKLPEKRLAESMGSLKIGYGGFEKQVKTASRIGSHCKDLRSIDNSAMEMAELCRGATDFIIDLRDLSDGYNLLTYPMISHVGGVITTKTGHSLAKMPIQPEAKVNYVAASSQVLHRRITDLLE